MSNVRVLALCLAILFSVVQAEDTASPGADLLKSTFRLRLQTEEAEYFVTGWGTAFGVNLAKFGLDEPRYMLSAAHLVLDKDGNVSKGDLTMEVPSSGRKCWVHCKVIAVDRNRDLCLLKAGFDLPQLYTLQEKDICKIGESVSVVGCPRGVEPRISIGKLIDKKPKIPGKVWEAEAKFDHGNSGGPVFSTDRKQIIGVAVAGVPDDRGEMDPNVALFAPVEEINRFLAAALNKRDPRS